MTFVPLHNLAGEKVYINIDLVAEIVPYTWERREEYWSEVVESRECTKLRLAIGSIGSSDGFDPDVVVSETFDEVIGILDKSIDWRTTYEHL